MWDVNPFLNWDLYSSVSSFIESLPIIPGAAATAHSTCCASSPLTSRQYFTEFDSLEELYPSSTRTGKGVQDRTVARGGYFKSCNKSKKILLKLPAFSPAQLSIICCLHQCNCSEGKSWKHCLNKHINLSTLPPVIVQSTETSFH